MPKPKESTSASTSKSTSHNKSTSKKPTAATTIDLEQSDAKKAFAAWWASVPKPAPSVSPQQPQVTEAEQDESNDDN
eukprot:6120092-Pleurochrysis_carterae.AAC.1